MAIREATAADIPALLPLLRAYCDFYESEPPEAGLDEMLRALLAAPEDRSFVLVATGAGAGAGEVIGFACCDWTWSSLRGARVVVLMDLFVDPAARGAGHADALIQAVADVGRRRGAAAVVWLTAPDNHRAHAVYDRAGGRAEPLLEYELPL